MLMLTVTLAALLAWTPAGDDKADSRAELARHQGTWEVVTFVYQGREAPREITATMSRVVEGDHVTWYRAGKSFAGTGLVLDVTATPKAIDVIADGGPQRGKAVRGIYRLEGDELTICMAAPDAPRPTTFDAPEGSKRTLMTFRKRKP